MSMRIESVGHAVFAVAMIAIGILGLIKGDFTVVWQPVPKGVPAREVLAYLCAFIPLATGIALLWQRAAATAARILLAYLLLWLLVLRVPPTIMSFTVDQWWSSCKTAVLVSAAWVLYTWFATDWDRRHLSFASGDKGLRIARVLFGLGLIPFGLAHFLYLKATTILVPGWLPWHVFWAYFTGATFIAAGVAVIIGVFARLAAALSVLQMGLFSLVVWVPILLRGSLSEFQMGEVVITFVLTAAGWVVADSYRGKPWLGMGQR